MHIKSIPRIVVSGLRGGSGKTILSLCLIASGRKKGLQITPFKKGPDYIDAGWLAKAADSLCFNLDPFMMSANQILRSFADHSEGSDMAIIEGNRGLYDGVDHKGSYSTARLAKLLKAPVIMVIDCTKTTNTIAAMVLGCQKMDPEVLIAGVVLNNVATERQESLIRKAIKSRCGLPVLGAIPRLKKDLFPERHMGLTPHQEHISIKQSLTAVKKLGDKYLDISGILKIAKKAGTITQSTPPPPPLCFAKRSSGGTRGQAGPGIRSIKNKSKTKSAIKNLKSKITIGVIRDSAFQFYYPDNFEALEKMGAKLVDISPLKQKELPDLDALYIGGGFPETHVIALSKNTRFKESLRIAVEKGLPVYAECGGLMYLGKSLILNQKEYPMTGIFPIVFDLEKKPQAHGYTVIKVNRANPYFPKGCTLKGHEFHYSRILEFRKGKKIHMAFNVLRGKGIKNSMDGICYNNVLAAYTHLHALSSKEWGKGMMKCARDHKKRKETL